MDSLSCEAGQDDFRRPIVKPCHFHGRRVILDRFLSHPWRVLVILGGRGMGKTSVLNQFAHHLTSNTHAPHRMLPVKLNLNSEKPASTGRFLHLLLSKLEAARGTVPSVTVPDSVNNPEFESRLQIVVESLTDHQFSGVCFLLDECESLVGQKWWRDDASGFLRSLLESSLFGLRVGFVLTGFRALRDHRQKVGSRLMEQADWEYLVPLDQADTVGLISDRCGPGKVSEEEVAEIYEQAGGHPMLTQRLVSLWIEARTDHPQTPIAQLSVGLRYQLRDFFEDCWGENGYSGGFTPPERLLYRLVLQCKELTVPDAAERTDQSELDCRQALEILQATGVIIALGNTLYRTGSRLFADWARTSVFLHSAQKEERPNVDRDKVFVSYSHQDHRFLAELEAQLKPYLRHGTMTRWSDRQIAPGSKWFAEIKAALDETSVAVNADLGFHRFLKYPMVA